MPLLAPTKGKKKAAKRAARRQGGSVTKEVPSSNVEYTIVGTIEPERLDPPAILFTPIQDSATSTRNVAVSIPQHSSPVSPVTIVTARSISSISPHASTSNTRSHGPQSLGPPPTFSALPLESLGSFNDSFTFTAPTDVATFGEHYIVTEVSKHAYVSSLSQDVEAIEDESPNSLGFSEAFVKDLRSPRFTTVTASTRAFEEVLSRKPDAAESSIFTRLKAVTTTNASAPVHEDNFPWTAVGVEEKPEVSLDYADQEWALVPYCRLKPLSFTVGYKVDQDLDENGTDLSLESILRSRMFLASADGVLQCIAYDQLLHDVETIKDDGGSDFDSIASPSKGYLENCSDAYEETCETIDSRFEDAPSGLRTRDRLHNGEDSAGVESLEVPDGCLQPAITYEMDREELSSHAEGSSFGSDGAASVSTEKCEVVGTHQGRLGSTTRSDSKEEIHEAPMNEVFDEELAETVSTSPQVPVASNCGSDVRVMRLGTEPLSSYLEVMEVDESRKATRDAVVTAFLKLVNIERKKRGVHALPSQYTAHSVLSSSILQHTVKLGTTTVASFVAQLCFDEKDEVETVDVCAAWDRLGHEKVQQ